VACGSRASCWTRKEEKRKGKRLMLSAVHQDNEVRMESGFERKSVP